MKKRRYYLIIFMILFAAALWGLMKTVISITPMPNGSINAQGR